MAVIGTFGSFTAARLGIYASQSSLNVTGNNIANINTEGYTRQRADLVSIHSYGGIRYANSYNLNIGYGVLVDSVSQLRDPFLDIRYRNENSNVGAYEEKLDCLQQLSHILDEVGKGNNEFGVLEGQFDDLLQQIQNFNGKVGSVEYDTTVRGSAETLTRLFNDYAKAMETLEKNKLSELNKDVTSVNTLLTQIRDLSVEIREAGLHGDKALELRDARNVCIDKLSGYMKIDVKYDMEKIDEFNSVERINISIADSGNPPIKLIQGIYGAQITMGEKAPARNPEYRSDLPTSNQYISQDSDFSDPANPIVKYTTIEREALRNGTGQVITNDAAGQALLGAMTPAGAIPAADYYDPGLSTTGKYLLYNENGEVIGRTNDPDDNWNGGSTYVDNALEGSDKNHYFMTVEPLVDAKGRYMRDQYHKEIKESVDLSDTQLYGSLQSLREFLTEEGEFASDDDLKFDYDAAHKRGIKYYKKSLDALARKFADTFNEANRLNFDQVSQAYKTGEVEIDDPNDTNVPPAKITITAFIDKDGNAIKDADGNVINSNEFDQLAKDIADFENLQDLKEQLKEVDAKAKAAQDALDAYTGTDLDTIDKLTAVRDAAVAEQKALNDRITELDAPDYKEQLEVRKAEAYEKMETLRTGGGVLTTEWKFYDGGVLFSNNGDKNDGANITAKNITISKDWSVGNTRILNTKKPDEINPNNPDEAITHTTRDDNLLHMINLLQYDFDYLPNEIVTDAADGGSKKYFTGSYQERLADMNSILAVETQTTILQYSTYTGQALTLENSRQSISGVDLNDEATNMMVYQKAYAAACTLMTTLDSMLDKLINNTIR